jgi:hypothetical protein
MMEAGHEEVLANMIEALNDGGSDSDNDEGEDLGTCKKCKVSPPSASPLDTPRS